MNIPVEIKDIETDPTGRMITLIINVVIEDSVEQIRVGVMVGELAGMTNEETQKRFIQILRNVLTQKLGEKQELNSEGKWSRAADFIGTKFPLTIEVPINSNHASWQPTLKDVPIRSFLRDTKDATKVWKFTIDNGVIVIEESSLEEYVEGYLEVIR